MTTPKLKPAFLLLTCIYCFAITAQAQTTDTAFIHKATTALSEFTTKQPVEKVYLHLDKPYYAAGDDIWFRVYVTSGGMHQLSAISGALTVELVNEKGDQVQTIQLFLKYGLAAGDFHLPYTTAAGRYHIRAYTNYMRNWGNDYFFDQPVTIANVANNGKIADNAHQNVKAIAATQAAANATLASVADVQFFPESGSLVNGIGSRIAFKAVGTDGRGINVKGLVTANAGAEAARFTSQHLGMGSFTLYPLAGTSYSARLTFDDSSHRTVNLAAALNSGYVLRIGNNKDNADVVFRVSYAGDSTVKKVADSTLILIVQSAGYTCYAAKLRLRGSIITGRIPREKLPTGISQFTLFSQSGEPLCERLIFINNHDQLTINLVDSNKTNATHQLTTIKLAVHDAENKPSIGSFSAAVVDDSAAPDNNVAEEENILSYLLLTSDIKGKIEAPGYYFGNENDTTAAALDLLMMTQGYRHFEWKKILDNKIPPLTYQPENGIKVTGHLATPGGKPVGGGNVTLFNKQSNLVLDTIADEHGSFVFNNMMFTDSLKVLLTAKTAAGNSDVQVIVDKMNNGVANMAMTNDVQKARVGVDTIPAVYHQLTDKKYKEYPNNGAVLLNEVKINSTRAKTGASQYSANLNGSGNADQILTSKDFDSQGGDLGQILNGRLLGINVVNNKLISNRSGSFRGSRAMLLILDGTYFSGDLSSINPLDIESLEILKSGMYTAIYGSRGGNGVAIITTKHGGSNENYVPPVNAATVTLTGFYKAREFYSPKYDGNKTNSELADLRSTIYWKPDVITDKEGNASFNFYNAGAKSTYRVIVQGIDINGKLGYQLLKYKVE